MSDVHLALIVLPSTYLAMFPFIPAFMMMIVLYTSKSSLALLLVEGLWARIHLNSSSQYSPFLKRRDSRLSWEWKSESWMVKVKISFQMSHSKKDLRWPFRIPNPIPMTISSLVFSGTGCITLISFAFLVRKKKYNILTEKKQIVQISSRRPPYIYIHVDLVHIYECIYAEI